MRANPTKLSSLLDIEPSVLVVLNGFSMHRRILKKLANRAKQTIATDGAAQMLFKKNIIPNLVIGDMDSIKLDLSNKSQFTKLEFLEILEQTSTDSQKALNKIVHEGNFKLIHLASILGSRIDHLQYNLRLIKFFRKQNLNILAWTNNELIMVIDFPLVIDNHQNRRLSFWGDQNSRLNTSGLQYAVTTKIFQQYGNFNISNSIKDKEALIDLQKGEITLVLEYNSSII